MDYLIEQFFDSWYKLYDIFGWWSAALVSAVFLLMLPVNYVYIKLFAIRGVTEQKERIRKVLSSLTVFAFSGGVIALFAVFISRQSELTFRFVYQSAIPCGVLAMALRAVYKFIRDIGFKPVLKAFLESEKLKQEIGKYISHPPVIDMVQKFLKGKLSDIDSTPVHERAEKHAELSAQLASKLVGVADRPADVAKALADYCFGRE